MTDNVYQRLLKARIALKQEKLRKSGKNHYAKYEYYELGDFLPALEKIEQDVGIVTVISFDSPDTCSAQVININNPEEQITFSSASTLDTMPNQKVSTIQQLGASHTYMRRYMYQLVFDIIEPDAVEACANRPQTASRQPQAQKANAKPRQASSATDKQQSGAEVAKYIADQAVGAWGKEKGQTVYNALKEHYGIVDKTGFDPEKTADYMKFIVSHAKAEGGLEHE